MLPLPQTVTLAEARDTLRMLSQALQREGGDALVVDASPLREFDSAVLAVLLECRRLAAAFGKRFTLHGAPPKLKSLATLYGISELLPQEAAPAQPS
jgi:phospholipid transport system transporter-binding protein